MLPALGFGFSNCVQEVNGVAICAANRDWWIVHLRGT